MNNLERARQLINETDKEMANLFEKMGCKKAYNLDGGHSAVMTWQGEIASSPSKPGGRDISDIVYIATDTFTYKGEEK